MFKKIIAILCLIAIFLVPAQAQEVYAKINGITSNKVHLRVEPSSKSKSLGLYFTGTNVVCKGDTSKPWVLVHIGSQNGYIKRDYLAFSDGPVPQQPTGIIKSANGRDVNVRKTPSLKGKVLFSLPVNTEVLIHGETSSKWYLVVINGEEGYIKSNYVKLSPTTNSQKQRNIASYRIYKYQPTKTISMEYPQFIGEKFKGLNAVIEQKIKEPFELGYNELTYTSKSAVTFMNSKIVSIVFWGNGAYKTSAFPTTDLSTLNIDLKTLQNIPANEIFNINSNFESVFFKKAFYPGSPQTSFTQREFPDMLALQAQDSKASSRFVSYSYFLKNDGVVFSLPSVHATGNDHFEAQVNFDDISNYIINGKGLYWK